MTWNHNIDEVPRDGSHVLMATTDGKRYLTRWLAPTKFTPSGRFDGFSENAKTLLAWASVPEHPFAAASQGEVALQSPGGSIGANAGGGHVDDSENAHSVAAGEQSEDSSSPDHLIVHKHVFLEDCGSGA